MKNKPRYTILLADDHPLTLMGTKKFLEELGHQVLDTASNGIVALNLINLLKPQVALLDVNMPGLSGLEVLDQLRHKTKDLQVVLITMHREVSIYRKALELGVNGYVLKEHAREELPLCFATLAQGAFYLSPSLSEEFNRSSAPHSQSNDLTFTERKIIELIGQHKTSKQIADELFLSEKTVENNRSRIIEKLGIPKEKNALLKWVLQQSNK